MEGCYIWQVLNVENYHAIIAVSFRGSWFMSCRDGLIFADSTGLVLDIPLSQGTLGKICGDGQTIGLICLPTSGR